MRPPTPARRVRRIALYAALSAGLYTALGFLVLPPIVRSQLQQRLSTTLGRTVTVEKVRLNPYTLALTVEGLRIAEADGGGTFLGWQRFRVDFDALGSLRGNWVLGEVDLSGLEVAVSVRPGGGLNFSDLLEKFAAPATQGAAGTATPTAPGRPLRIDRLQVTGARAVFSDGSRAKPFTTTVGPLSFALTGFHTRGGQDAPYRFEAETDAGEKLGWSGTLQAVPFRSVGEFRIENIPLNKYEPYHDAHLRADLVEGRLSVRGRYELALADPGRIVRLTGGALQLRGLRILERPGREPVLELPALDLTGITADALTRRTEVAKVSLTGGYLRARREKDGTLNLLALLPPPAAVVPGTPPATPPPGSPGTAALPDFRVAEVELRECALDVIDLAAPRPVSLKLTSLRLGARNVTLAEGASLPVDLAFSWAPRGTVRLGGEVTLRPQLQARLQTEVTGLDLLPLSPYLEQFLAARLTQGNVSTRHTLELAATAAGPVATLTGDFQAARFSLVDAVHHEDLAGLAALDLQGLKLNTAAPGQLEVAEVSVTGPYARVTINPDRSLNLTSLLRPSTPPAPAAAAAAPPAAAPAGAAAPAPASPRIEVARLAIRDGEFTFADRSISPAVQTTLGQFGGTLSGLSSAHLARAEVDLTGTVDGAGPVRINGRLDPFGARRFVDLKIDGRNVDLLPFSPYSGRFAGFELARGKLGVDVQVRLDGSALDAANVVRVDRLTFGAPVASPDATKLPVRLGVALLKDLDGRIVIDLPIQGRLDDPEFRIGRVVGRVLVNLLTKAAVSPFTLLGSMFGGGGEELAFQEFAPGSSALQAAELPKLATLIKALGNRPELSLALEGGYDQAADTHALKRVKLAERVRRAVWEARHTADPGTPPPAQLVLTPGEEAAMLKELYDRQFPPGTEFGTPLPAAPEVVRPPAPPAGLFQRMIRAVTGQAKKEALAADQENTRRQAEHRQAMQQALAHARPIDEMIGRLAETITVNDDDLAALATARAQRVREHLVAQGQLAADRFFLAKPAGATPATTPANRGPRVFLSLQ